MSRRFAPETPPGIFLPAKSNKNARDEIKAGWKNSLSLDARSADVIDRSSFLGSQNKSIRKFNQEALGEAHLAVPDFLHQMEQSGLSTWLRESPSIFGFYFVLVFHTIGLSLVVGPNIVIDLRLIGYFREIPLPPLKRWFKIMWLGFTINAISGVFLVIAYPVKALTNPVFYLKLTFIGLAIWTMTRIKKQIFDDSSLSAGIVAANARTLAMSSIALWVVAITAGRLLAYTCSYLVYGVPCE
jgi:hypothetical protein